MLNEKYPKSGLTCDMVSNAEDGTICVVVKYNGFDAGSYTSKSLPDAQEMFARISARMSDGAQLRLNILMLNYHTKELSGDVLTIEGEKLGCWHCDEEEWCFFTPNDAQEPACAAPSLWPLHDNIARWLDPDSLPDDF
ncbi:hypothetical protein [Shimia marina]|uniref:Uncharacterized protein n=1 Tax=Shimia marina TaxID=321267 RepID=A0A0P1FGI0_9RHOB|nr:hypothetical protein [Shimia marina]CUH52991.1 hypothetical protein SHM7688_02442 [Shimia marina]SFD91913.1 hypothetical protein SAMN04488037_103243 [Shimia marina]